MNSLMCLRLRYVLLALTALLLSALAGPVVVRAQPFLPDDPVWVDPDRLDMPHPEPQEMNEYIAFLRNTFTSPGEVGGPAVNVNTLGEVPNSSWYTNRHYWHPMTIEELKRGPNTTGGPAEGPWKVVSLKKEGKSAGMQIVDARGDRYILKFDPEGYIELSTGAEVVATKFFYALGYNVPENYIARFRPERLVPGEESGLTKRDIEEVLDKAPMYPDGTYRALASKFIEGIEILGPFRYYGTRRDDANDVFPHEARRELRGLRVFAAWLQHDDTRAMNTLDVLVEETFPDGDRHFVRHYLIDFGSTMGGGPTGPKVRWAGYEYLLDPVPMLARAFSLGFAGSEWVEIDYPGYPSIGHFEAEHFEPREWHPRYPNPAFVRMDARDAFWAAKQVMNFTPDEIRAIVSTGQYTNEEAEAYLVEVLIKRQQEIGAAYLWLGGGLDRFRVEGDTLVFADLLARHGFVEPDRRRTATWYVYDNTAAEIDRRLAAQTTAKERLALPAATPPFLMVHITTDGEGWTRAYLRRTPDGYEMVGLKRGPYGSVGERERGSSSEDRG